MTDMARTTSRIRRLPENHRLSVIVPIPAGDDTGCTAA
jgi:hypothetical protein